MRYAMKRAAALRPLLGLFGGTEARSYVELDDRALHIRFGPLFDEAIALDRIERAVPSEWPLIGGLGWRTNFVDTVALVGSYQGVVRVDLKERTSVRMLFPLRVDRVYLSLEDPAGFLSEMRDRLEAPPPEANGHTARVDVLR